MCIRDRPFDEMMEPLLDELVNITRAYKEDNTFKLHEWDRDCLLYTSDAADERSSVDLGGRRIIKKKKKENTRRRDSDNQKR